MEVSKITLLESTRAKLEAPMSKKKKSALRITIVKEYIRSRPSGEAYPVSDIIKQLRYKINGSAWAFVDGLVKKGIINRQKTIKSAKCYWSVAEDVKREASNKVVKAAIDLGQEIERHVSKEKSNPTIAASPRQLFADDVTNQAKEFAWEKDSDSLREFITWLRR